MAISERLMLRQNRGLGEIERGEPRGSAVLKRLTELPAERSASACFVAMGSTSKHETSVDAMLGFGECAQRAVGSYGSIAVPAVEGWQLLYFGGAKNNVGCSCFGISTHGPSNRAGRFSRVAEVPFC